MRLAEVITSTNEFTLHETVRRKETFMLLYMRVRRKETFMLLYMRVRRKETFMELYMRQCVVRKPSCYFT